MSQASKIEWTDATWNPTRGCTEVAPGCAHCYAKVFAERFRGVPGHPYERGFDPRLAPHKLTEPLKWQKPRRIFVDSMSDLFHEAFPDEYIAACFGVMAAARWHTYQILTKRPERAAFFFRRGWSVADCVRQVSAHGLPSVASFNGVRTDDLLTAPWPLPNVWIGTSIANQTDADRNIPHLLQVPAAVRFLSVEPLLGPIEFSDVSRRADAVEQLGRRALAGIDWVIVGGESGPGARPCNIQWIRSIVAQCKAVGVPVFVKQLGKVPMVAQGDLSNWPDWNHPAGQGGDQLASPVLDDPKGGDWTEWPADLRVRAFPEVSA